MELVDPIVFRLTIFVLAIFIGYFVVWAVTPALHTPLMSVTNAISSVIVVGALIAVGVSTHAGAVPTTDQSAVVSALNPPPAHETVLTSSAAAPAVSSAEPYALADQGAPARAAWISKLLGFGALILACVNIFGGFLVTSRMLAMYKKKEK